MASKKESGKKGGFALAPIRLSEPIKATDGFTNLVETPAVKKELAVESQLGQETSGNVGVATKTKREVAKTIDQTLLPMAPYRAAADAPNDFPAKADDEQSEKSKNGSDNYTLSVNELLRILEADSLDEIYELSDILRASSLKLYAALIRLADSRGRTRVKNHELMSKAGIKGIATLYKQERWLMDLKLLEKKAKPGPHDGSSYVVHKLETLPLPAEIYDKFEEYLSILK